MLSTVVHFPPKYHPIHDYFGLNDFVVLSPNAPYEKEDIDNETRAKIALSTVTVAVHNTNCQVPFFVQVMDRYKHMYNGVFAGCGFRTNFEMVVLSKKPPHSNHLSGLLTMFKKKLCPSIEIDIPSVRVTVRCCYALNDWTSHAWSQAPPDIDMFSLLGSQLDFVSDLSSLPFGSTKDPVKRLKLYTTWCDLQEDIITDNDVHTDLEPLEAPAWSIGVQFESRPHCLLAEYLGEFSNLGSQNETLKELLGDLVKDGAEQHLEKLPNVFNKLTGPTYTLSDIIQSGKSPRKIQGGPIKDEYLTSMLEYIFPDSSMSPEHPYPSEFNSCPTNMRENENQYRVSLGGIKSSPVDGLVWRLAIVLGHCLRLLGGIKPFAHLINEFVLEVRFRWESGQLLPGMPKGPPDHSHCLLQQKLQMINCCIEKKLARENRIAGKSIGTTNINSESLSEPMCVSDSESEDDEFFECNDSGQEEDNEQVQDIEVPEKSDQRQLPVWDNTAAGRQSRFGKHKLLEHDDYIYVPICQDPTPMTEDMLAEQAEVMLQLGMDTKGTELRAKMQSTSLLSDMESFKAANPGSILSDFIRWHSPRDWEDDTGKGKLSARMNTSGNLWQETWENAKPVSARRQKRLFDDTREAEKVLQYFTTLRPSEFSQILMPNFLHCAILRILQESFKGIPDVDEILKELILKVCQATRLRCPPEVKHYMKISKGCDFENEFARRTILFDDVIKLLEKTEIKISRAYSLQTKFMKNFGGQADEADKDDTDAVKKQMNDFITRLYNEAEVPVLGSGRGPTGQLICKMFGDAYRAENMTFEDDGHVDVFPQPDSREFILRTCVGRPYPYSQSAPQRMYCSVTKNEFRVAGGFTIDKQFL